ncbi:hypothetical protein [Nocardia harenae]|uniref:hypothetical protein n=1 Tax=Nocardia harenae TaxID=358707 RepID=UPI00082CD36F|nr:hypothetical protein [Nocardia harenae]
MEQIAGWWDGFELWVAGLPFIPQFLVVLLGMVPISVAIATGLDRTLRAVLHLLGRDRTPEPGETPGASAPADRSAALADPSPAPGASPGAAGGTAPIVAAGQAGFVGPPLATAAGPAGVR